MLKKIFADYFGLVALAAIAIAAIAGAVVRHSLVSGLLAGLGAIVAIVGLLLAMGPTAAIIGGLHDIYEEAVREATPLSKAFFRAWARGLILWIPPHAVANEFLMFWAAVIAGAFFLSSRVHAWPHGGRAGAVLAFVIVSGFVNAAFHRG